MCTYNVCKRCGFYFTSQTTSNHYLSYTFFNWNTSLSPPVWVDFGLIRKFLHCLHYLIQKITFSDWCLNLDGSLCVCLCCSLKLFPACSDKMCNQNIQSVIIETPSDVIRPLFFSLFPSFLFYYYYNNTESNRQISIAVSCNAHHL